MNIDAFFSPRSADREPAGRIPARLKSEFQDWQTPLNIVEAVNAALGSIALDPCSALGGSPWAQHSFDGAELGCGLANDWRPGWFANPPFGALRAWTAKAAQAPPSGVLLMPCGPRFSTAYFQKNVLTAGLTAMCVLRKRVRFLRDGRACGKNIHDTALWCYGAGKWGELNALGVVLSVKLEGPI